MLATLYGVLAQTANNNGSNGSGLSPITWVIIAVVAVIVLWLLFRSFARRGGAGYGRPGYRAAAGPRFGGRRRWGYGRRRWRNDRAA